MADDATTPVQRRRWRRGRRSSGLAFAAFFVVVYRQVLGITQRPSWPPPPDAVTSADAQAATEAFAARDGTRPHDAALDFAWSTAATIEPLVEGANFFPRIFADVEAARSSVHILMFGWREGEVGMRMAALLERKLAEGVEVRVIVDGFGSRPYKEARRDVHRPRRRPERRSWSTTSSRSTATVSSPTTSTSTGARTRSAAPTIASCTSIDGAVAWTGGAGIEDHFENGGFHDVMVRVTGDVVRQAQAAFLTSFRGHGGPLPRRPRPRTSPSRPTRARRRSRSRR